MHVRRNIEARSCSHCCHGKAVSVKFHECKPIFLRLFCAALHCHLWHFWFYRIFSHSLLKGTICISNPCHILIKLDFLDFLKILRYQIS